MTVRSIRSLDDICAAAHKVSRYRTGVPTIFSYIRNQEPSPKRIPGDPYLQKVEPAGAYMIERPVSFEPGRDSRWDSGQVRFENPIVLPWGANEGYSASDNWKRELSLAFGGKTGESLTLAVLAKGFDAVITVDSSGDSSEVVSFAPMARQWRLDLSDSGHSIRERMVGPVKVLYQVASGLMGEPLVEIVHLETKYKDRGKGCAVDAVVLLMQQVSAAQGFVCARIDGAWSERSPFSSLMGYIKRTDQGAQIVFPDASCDEAHQVERLRQVG